MSDAQMRLDKFLWFARLAKTRSAAQAIAASGHLRIDSRPIDRAHAAIRTGQVIAFPQGPNVRVLRIEALPSRRGPAPEAQRCYTDLIADGKVAL
ncbi:MAG: RNA-binding protein [Sphingomonadales bacterium]|nr:RNA-binding protein [Sphingomonadales bacterium]